MNPAIINHTERGTLADGSPGLLESKTLDMRRALWMAFQTEPAMDGRPTRRQLRGFRVANADGVPAIACSWFSYENNGDVEIGSGEHRVILDERAVGGFVAWYLWTLRSKQIPENASDLIAEMVEGPPLPKPENAA